MKKKVFLEEDAHYELSIKEKEDKTVYKLNLTTANHIPMVSHGKRVAKIVDDGNCIMVNGTPYDYCEFEALMILANQVLEHQKGQWSNVFISPNK